MPDADHHADTAAAHKQKKTHDTLAGCCMQEGSDNTKHIIITMWTEDKKKLYIYFNANANVSILPKEFKAPDPV